MVWFPSSQMEDRTMGKKRFSDEKIIRSWRQADNGEKVDEICWQLGVSEQRYYKWKRKYAGLGLSEL